jgi:hypothetical protein
LSLIFAMRKEISADQRRLAFLLLQIHRALLQPQRTAYNLWAASFVVTNFSILKYHRVFSDVGQAIHYWRASKWRA